MEQRQYVCPKCGCEQYEADRLQATGGNRMAAARLLQISRASLYERLAKWPDLESKVQVSGNA